ncbi:MAG: gamma-glutamyltransferase [Candidatus Aminicenantes bacterium]|nr:gamma-glutamyltransferase [Candidatus Aminicenantes bacterium]
MKKKSHPKRPATVAFCWILLAFLVMTPGCRKSREGPPTAAADRHAPLNYQGRRAMVVAAHPLAVEAGLKTLRRGGNAVDAAIATASALNAAEPFASGIGGGGFMVIHLAREKKTAVINFREKAPLLSSPRMFSDKGEEEKDWRTASGLAVAVPGALAGWDLALRKYGTRPLAEVLAEAIAIAEKGITISPTFSDISKEEYERMIKNLPDGSAYLNEGLPREPGEHFRNPDLARTLRLIAARGVDEFYRGELARKTVAAVQEKHGIMTMEDLASYVAVEVEPLRGTYKDLTIITAPPPASGGLHLIQFLNILERWPVRTWGLNSVSYVHHMSEALRFIFADRALYLGDPESVPVPVRKLISKERAAAVVSLIQDDRPLDAYPAPELEAEEKEAENTTHLCVVDAAGNIVSLTQSINDFFGTGIVPEGTGFLLNNHMDDFALNPESPNAPGPGRRPVSYMAPLILFKEGRPFIVLGSPGGSRIFSSLTQIILNVTEFGLSLDDAIEAPRFFSSSTRGKPAPVKVESRLPEAAILALREMGHEVDVLKAYDKYFGGAQGIMILRPDGILHGGADSRRDGTGGGY